MNKWLTLILVIPIERVERQSAQLVWNKIHAKICSSLKDLIGLEGNKLAPDAAADGLMSNHGVSKRMTAAHPTKEFVTGLGPKASRCQGVGRSQGATTRFDAYLGT